MRLVQITPGAGGMYCGNCFRDNALVAELRRQGHETLMLPMYLPMTLDETSQSGDVPIFFSGINVYLEQKAPIFKHAPRWLRNLLSSPALLKVAAGKAAKTRASDLGDLTLSMLRGEEGNQARELDELVEWLRSHGRPDVIALSNALLLGLARRLKKEFGSQIVCTLQGEDEFLDALPEPFRRACWDELSLRAREVDRFIPPSRYFGDRMASRLALRAEQVRVVPNGISLIGYPTQPTSQAGSAPVLGYFARMCREKGLDRLVDAYLLARRRVPQLRLKIGGACGPADEPFVESCRERLAKGGAADQVEFHKNVPREEKIQFLSSLTLFSVPAAYSEAFGLYLIEAMAAGVPVVQPRHASYPEIVEETQGGVLCENTVEALAEAIADLALDPARQQLLGRQAHAAVHQRYTVEAMARHSLLAFQ